MRTSHSNLKHFTTRMAERNLSAQLIQSSYVDPPKPVLELNGYSGSGLRAMELWEIPQETLPNSTYTP